MKHLLYVSWFIFFVVAAAPPVWGVEQGGGGYAGSDACLSCHEKQAALMKKSPHWKKAVPGSPINGEGCESCHGPGAAHAEAGGGKGVGGLTTFGKGESAERKSAVCLKCHENSTQLAMWDSGVHKKQDVACSDCHTLHGPPKAAAGYGTTLDRPRLFSLVAVHGVPQVPPRHQSPDQQKVSPSHGRRKDHVLRLP